MRYYLSWTTHLQIFLSESVLLWFETNLHFIIVYRSPYPIAEQDCWEFAAVLATTDGAEKTGTEGEDEGSTVKVAREEVLKDDDVGAVDPEGEDVGAEVDAERGATRDEIGAKVSAEIGAEVTDNNVVCVHREDEVWEDKVVWSQKVGGPEAEGETPVPVICVPVVLVSATAVPPEFTVSSVVVGEDGMVKQRTVPSCLRSRLSGSLDPAVIFAWKHD